MPPKQDRKARPGSVQCHWCGQLFDDTRKRDYHQEICEFYGSRTTPRAQDIGMPEGYMTFRTFCNENRILRACKSITPRNDGLRFAKV